ncbi:MAG: DNA-protecting protein DprA, partial [Clostridia bacterium]|nr:DNA-protecting protein DprA [Clostridia bacterium]
MKTITLEDLEYPKSLKKIKSAPREIFVEGNIKCFNMPCVTVVGSRNMSEYGKKMTRKIVKELVKADVCIVSGLAVGIDTVAHETCLENGGKTIAVLGSGLNKVFPVENTELFKRIVNSGGCVLSEQMPDEEAKKVYFPARNR